ncbi:MAG: GNAT family N-acetyltransferase [Pseudomonadota bacterium]
MPQTILIRPTTAADVPAVDALLARAYPRLLKGGYPPSVLVTAVPIISRARPELLASGTYYLAEDAAGRVLGAAGWTRAGPSGEAARGGRAHVRHVATDPAHARQGIGRRLMGHVLAEARAGGVTRLDCLATLPAVPFYAALGFEALGPGEVPLRPGIALAVERMRRTL